MNYRKNENNVNISWNWKHFIIWKLKPHPIQRLEKISRNFQVECEKNLKTLFWKMTLVSWNLFPLRIYFFWWSFFFNSFGCPPAGIISNFNIKRKKCLISQYKNQVRAGVSNCAPHCWYILYPTKNMKVDFNSAVLYL